MTDRTDFETMVERRMRAYAAAGAHPGQPSVIARAAMTATVPVRRSPMFAGPRRPTLLIGLAAILLLAVAAGTAFIGGPPVVIRGVFVDGPSLDDGRIASAVALPDGRVLIGVAPDDTMVLNGTTTLLCRPPCLPQLVVIDPRTRAVTPTRDAVPSQRGESLVLLPDGRVLIVGGPTDGGAARAATIYDPVADRFDAVGAPIERRSIPFVATLPDGRILIGGGQADQAVASVELFDPATGTFAPTGSLDRPRGVGATATTLLDGRVLVLGGGPDLGTSAELYDPATGTFVPTGSMTVARGGLHSATLLPDGRVLVAGGLVVDDPTSQTFPDPTATAEIYDPTTGAFTAVGQMRAPRYLHSASVLADGSVLVVGGAHEPGTGGVPGAAADAEIFDPSTGAFRPTGDLRTPRLWPAIVPVDGRLLVLGTWPAFGADDEAGSTTEWFD